MRSLRERGQNDKARNTEDTGLQEEMSSQRGERTATGSSVLPAKEDGTGRSPG